MNSHRDEVRRLLSSYEPGPPERDGMARMWTLLDAAGNVFDSAHFEPGHFTASGVVATRDFTEMVLIDHAKLGVWLQPGGHFESLDRSCAAAAGREVTEECGLTQLELIGLFDVDVHDLAARPEYPAHSHFDLRFLFVTDQRKLGGLDGVVDAAWVPVGGVVVRLGSTVQRLLDKVATLGIAGESPVQ